MGKGQRLTGIIPEHTRGIEEEEEEEEGVEKNQSLLPGGLWEC